MTFSIIIPVYNASAYIKRCLDSVVNQDFPKDEYEIIVIDDCSTEDTANVIERYISDCQQITPPICNIRLIRHLENKRQGGARNTGLKAAKGDWIFFLDSDDFWLSDKVLSSFSKFTALAPECDMIESSSHADVYDLSEIDRHLCGSSVSEVTSYHPYDYYRAGLYEGYIWIGCYKRSHIENNSFRENVFFEDGDWKHSVILGSSRIGMVDYPFYGYFNNMTSTIRQPKIEVFYANVDSNVMIYHMSERSEIPADVRRIFRVQLLNNLFSYIKISKEYSVIQSYKVFRYLAETPLINSSNFIMNIKQRALLTAMHHTPMLLVSSVKVAVLLRRQIRKLIKR